MRTLYFDCPMGISGDMCLGALIDAGVDAKAILRALKSLKADPFEVEIKKTLRHGISATTFNVKTGHSHHHRTFLDIKKLINSSKLKPSIKKTAIDIFTTIAVAEGRIHGVPLAKVHFHEVGAMDSIVDIVGCAVALDLLGIDEFYSSALALGSGMVQTMHGVLPIPAPATLEILRGTLSAPSPVDKELTTPTGAAIVKTLCKGFGPMLPMTIDTIGYGAGKKDFKEAANVARVIIGERGEDGEISERLALLEANIDDMTPEVAGFLMERLFSLGALDVFYTGVHMKKSRPGLLLTVLASPDKKDVLLEAIFTESTTIGVRESLVNRHCLERRLTRVKTRHGKIGVKVAYVKGKPVNAQPEYEECRRLALEKGVPLKDVMDGAKAAFNRK